MTLLIVHNEFIHSKYSSNDWTYVSQTNKTRQMITNSTCFNDVPHCSTFPGRGEMKRLAAVTDAAWPMSYHLPSLQPLARVLVQGRCTLQTKAYPILRQLVCRRVQ